jgi:hypothetical protein
LSENDSSDDDDEETREDVNEDDEPVRSSEPSGLNALADSVAKEYYDEHKASYQIQHYSSQKSTKNEINDASSSAVPVNVPNIETQSANITSLIALNNSRALQPVFRSATPSPMSQLHPYRLSSQEH